MATLITDDKALDEAINLLQDVEKLGEKILIDRELIVDFDHRRNKNREALRAITKKEPEKVWLCFGNMFIQSKAEKAKDIIQRDQQQLDKNIETMRDALKDKVNDLRRMQGKPEDHSFNLKPVTKKELEALNSVLSNVII